MISNRFEVIGEPIPLVSRYIAQPDVYHVIEKETDAEYLLKLWRKTGHEIDRHLRDLWHHELLQLQRLSQYVSANDLIPQAVELVEDDHSFGLLQPWLASPFIVSFRDVPTQNWIRHLDKPKSRKLLWSNVRRLVRALSLIHRLGLVHGSIDRSSILTDLLDQPDFRLSGFEWCIWLNAADQTSEGRSEVELPRFRTCYSYESDWRDLGLLIAGLLGIPLKNDGKDLPDHVPPTVGIRPQEWRLLRKLVHPTRLDILDPGTLLADVDVIIDAHNSQVIVSDLSEFILLPDFNNNGLLTAVVEASDYEVEASDRRSVADFLKADLAGPKTLLVPRDFDSRQSQLRLVTDNLVYTLSPYGGSIESSWAVAFCKKVQMRREYLTGGGDLSIALSHTVHVSLNRKAVEERRALAGAGCLEWTTYVNQSAQTSADYDEGIEHALLTLEMLSGVLASFFLFPVHVTEGIGKNLSVNDILVRPAEDPERDRFASVCGHKGVEEAFKQLFVSDLRDKNDWYISQSRSLQVDKSRDIAVEYLDTYQYRGESFYRFRATRSLPYDRKALYLKPNEDTGTETAMRRRVAAIRSLDTRADLVELLRKPWASKRRSNEVIEEDEHYRDLDPSKRAALKALWRTRPAYFVVGPPGVGKTRLATEVVRRQFSYEMNSKMLITAQAHDALDNLQHRIREVLPDGPESDLIVVRSARSNSGEGRVIDEGGLGTETIASGLVDRLLQSPLVKDGALNFQDRLLQLKLVLSTDVNNLGDSRKDDVDREDVAAAKAFTALVVDSANVLLSTANSREVERLVEDQQQFDWVVVEEAAKVTGPELVGPLMLSGRRLLIGDHHQLPPFDSHTMEAVLVKDEAMQHLLTRIQDVFRHLLTDDELALFKRMGKDPKLRQGIAGDALNFLEFFKTVVEQDEELAQKPNYSGISTILKHQRRMHPVLAQLVSDVFYNGELKTDPTRIEETKAPPANLVPHQPLTLSPLVVVDFPHIASSGKEQNYEEPGKRWLNPSEVRAVIEVLKSLHASPDHPPPTLAILSPYQAQVQAICQAIADAEDQLSHLDAFRPVRSGKGFVGTVDSFQGSEADIVVVSLVRNNHNVGLSALGFLREQRRMNVMLSRAKSQMILIGSLAFLEEAVRGVNPSQGPHDLSFITKAVSTIRTLSHETVYGGTTPAVTLLAPGDFGVDV